MRFTDNPLEILMRQRPQGGRDNTPVRTPPPACLKCPYRSSICEYGICWHIDNLLSDEPVDNKNK